MVKLTDDQKADLARRYRAGEAGQSLADELGIANTTMYRHLRKIGVDVRKQNAWTDERRKQFAAQQRERELARLAEYERHPDTDEATSELLRVAWGTSHYDVDEYEAA